MLMGNIDPLRERERFERGYKVESWKIDVFCCAMYVMFYSWRSVATLCSFQFCFMFRFVQSGIYLYPRQFQVRLFLQVPQIEHDIVCIHDESAQTAITFLFIHLVVVLPN